MDTVNFTMRVPKGMTPYLANDELGDNFERNAMLLYPRMAFLSILKRFSQAFHSIERHELLSAVFSHHHIQPDDLQ